MEYQESLNPEPLSDYELERGKPMPSRNHSILQSQLVFMLKRDFGAKLTIPSEIELVFLPKNAVPDICIYPKMQIDFEGEDEIAMKEPPLTAIEILSPRQALEEILTKSRKVYFANGVKSVWVVLMSLKTIVLLMPGAAPQYFRDAELFDPVTNIRLNVAEVFQS